MLAAANVNSAARPSRVVGTCRGGVRSRTAATPAPQKGHDVSARRTCRLQSGQGIKSFITTPPTLQASGHCNPDPPPFSTTDPWGAQCRGLPLHVVVDNELVRR